MKKSKKKSKSKVPKPIVDDGSIKKNQLSLYLQTWSTNRNEWKFEKIKQIKLVSGMLDSNKVPDDVFPIFVEYMENAKGKIRSTVIGKSNEIIEDMEKWTSLTSEEQEVNPKPDVNKYNRARMILQTLQ